MNNQYTRLRLVVDPNIKGQIGKDNIMNYGTICQIGVLRGMELYHVFIDASDAKKLLEDFPEYADFIIARRARDRRKINGERLKRYAQVPLG